LKQFPVVYADGIIIWEENANGVKNEARALLDASSEDGLG